MHKNRTELFSTNLKFVGKVREDFSSGERIISGCLGFVSFRTTKCRSCSNELSCVFHGEIQSPDRNLLLSLTWEERLVQLSQEALPLLHCTRFQVWIPCLLTGVLDVVVLELYRKPKVSLIARETTGAPILLHGFFKGSESDKPV